MNLQWVSSTNGVSRRNLAVEELTRTHSELPPLSLDTLVNMAPMEIKEVLGVAVAQTYHLVCEVGDQLKNLDV